jgi:hypothetical protein
MMLLYCCLYLIAVTETVLSFSPTSQTRHHNALSIRSSLNVFAIPVNDIDIANINLPIVGDVINEISNETEGSNSIPRGYHNARVLLVGDGDLSFAAALSGLKICKSLTATTWDSKERLAKSFPRAEENIRLIEEGGDKVQYEVDATRLKDSVKEGDIFDTIAWNFPHIAGKQNIKRNRELVQNFLVSAFSILKGDGIVKISLCDGQSGTKAADMDDWNFSWKLVDQVREIVYIIWEL